MAARLVAVVVAIALVAGAFVYRTRNDPEPGSGADGRPVLVCSTELADVCERVADVEVRIEPAGVTADALAALPDGARPDFDHWATVGPWPQIIADARTRATFDPVLDDPATVAATPIGLAVWPDRRAVIDKACAPLTWRCVGEQSSKQWGTIGGNQLWGAVKPGHADPVDEGAGLVVAGTLASGWFGRTDMGANDFADDQGFRDWLSGIERAVPALSSTALDDMLVRGPAAYDLVFALDAQAKPLLAEAAQGNKPVLIYPAPMTRAELVVASRPGRDGEELADRLGAAARDAGWGRSGPPGGGLPSPDVLGALRTTMQEVTR